MWTRHPYGELGRELRRTADCLEICVVRVYKNQNYLLILYEKLCNADWIVSEKKKPLSRLGHNGLATFASQEVHYQRMNSIQIIFIAFIRFEAKLVPRGVVCRSPKLSSAVSIWMGDRYTV